MGDGRSHGADTILTAPVDRILLSSALPAAAGTLWLYDRFPDPLPSHDPGAIPFLCPQAGFPFFLRKAYFENKIRESRFSPLDKRWFLLYNLKLYDKLYDKKSVVWDDIKIRTALLYRSA